jgi:hypothetical protein
MNKPLKSSKKKSGGNETQSDKPLPLDEIAPNECAIPIKGKTSVCSDTKTVKDIAEIIGASNKDPKVVIDKAKKELGCETESCVLMHPTIARELGEHTVSEMLRNRFLPAGPANTTELLSNHNIDNVLAQMTKKYKDFCHIPFQMRDFDKNDKNPANQQSLKYFNFENEYNNGKRTFGCVLNTDYSYGRGIHWFCLFGDFRKKPFVIEFFNTSGNPALPEVQNWISETKITLTNALSGEVEVKQVVTYGLQKDNSSCGVWCLYYIWNRLEGIESSVFSNPSKAPDDGMMVWARKHLFRSNS